MQSVNSRSWFKQMISIIYETLKEIWTLMEYLMIFHHPRKLSDGWEEVHGIVFSTLASSKHENHITSPGEGKLRFSGGSVFWTEISRKGGASRQKLKVRGWEWGIRWVNLSGRGNCMGTGLKGKEHPLKRSSRGLRHSVAREEAWNWNWEWAFWIFFSEQLEAIEWGSTRLDSEFRKSAVR